MIRTDKKSRNLNRILRWVVLFCITAAVTVLGRLHQISHAYPPIDAFCPFGGLESAYVLIRFGAMLRRIAWSSFIMLFITLGTVVLFRRAFCGNICPFGALQEFFGTIGRKIFKRRITIPEKADKILRYLKYLVLAFFLITTILFGFLTIRAYDPWVAYHHLFTGEMFSKYLIGFIVLMATFVGSFFFDRFFCKYLCPMGAFLGLINRIGIFRIKRNTETCIDCSKCSDICPVNIKVDEKTQVQSSECINCNECVNVCPVDDTLYVATRKDRKIKPIFVLIITVALFTGVIGVTTATGQFNFKRFMIEPNKILEIVQDPANIKGSTTFAEVGIAYNIPPATMMELFGIEQKALIKSIRRAGVSPEDLRKIIMQYGP